jgi:hypothetical protein
LFFYFAIISNYFVIYFDKFSGQNIEMVGDVAAQDGVLAAQDVDLANHDDQQ